MKNSNYLIVALCIVLLSVPSVYAQENVALGKDVVASSYQDYEYDPMHINDGNVSTRWSSNFNDAEWIFVDLESEYEISEVSFYWEYAYGEKFEIQISLDGEIWTTIANETNSNGNVDTYVVTPVIARYVKMNGILRGTEWGYSIWEFQVMGEIPTSSSSEIESLVQNGSFEYGLDAWDYKGGGVLLNEQDYFSIDVQNEVNPWEVNLSYPLALVEGAQYLLKFNARASQSRSLLTGLGQNHSPWTADNVQRVQLSTGWESFEIITETGFSDDSDARILFDMGDEVGEVSIDDVSLTIYSSGSSSSEFSSSSHVSSSSQESSSSISSSSSTHQFGSDHITQLTGGIALFHATFTEVKDYVELFIKVNGVQIQSVNLTSEATDNEDGTYTYAVEQGGFTSEDIIEVRFYTHKLGVIDVEPGPTVHDWDLFEYGQILVVYVADYGLANNEGTQEFPISNIEDGINKAIEIGATEVHVAEGAYEALGVQIQNGISLRGGYASDFSGRSTDLTVNRTVIDGGMLEEQGYVCHYQSVLYAREISSETHIDGFTITGGRICGYGGAIYVDHSSDQLLIHDNSIEENDAIGQGAYGANIAVINSSVKIYDNTIGPGFAPLSYNGMVYVSGNYESGVTSLSGNTIYGDVSLNGSPEPRYVNNTQVYGVVYMNGVIYEDPIPQYAGFSLYLNEEFESYNSDIWEFGTHTFLYNLVQFTPNNVEFVDGNMRLWVKEEPMGSRDYSGAEYRTRASNYRYGRYETRLKCPPGSGYAASLFTFNTWNPESAWEELDIEIEGQFTDRISANLFYGGNTVEARHEMVAKVWGPHAEDQISVFNTREWNVYAFEWYPDRVIWYINGTVVRIETQNVPVHANKVMMNFWITSEGTRFGGYNDGNTYPFYAEYDYFRFYKLDGDALYPQ